MHNGPHTHGILSTPYTSRQRQPARKWFSSDSAVQRPWERLKLEWHEVERISCVCRPLCVCIRMPACLCVRIRLGLSRHAASRLTENGRKGKRQRTGERGGGCGKGTAAGSRSGRWEWNLQRTKAETEKAKKEGSTVWLFVLAGVALRWRCRYCWRYRVCFCVGHFAIVRMCLALSWKKRGLFRLHLKKKKTMRERVSGLRTTTSQLV